MAKKRASSTTNGEQPINEISGGVRYINGLPSQLGRSSRAIGLIELAQQLTVTWEPRRKGFVGHRRFDPIKPTAKVETARRSERGTGELLGVKGVRTEKRAVLSLWKRTRKRLGGEGVAIAGLVRQVVHGDLFCVAREGKQRACMRFSYEINPNPSFDHLCVRKI